MMDEFDQMIDEIVEATLCSAAAEIKHARGHPRLGCPVISWRPHQLDPQSLRCTHCGKSQNRILLDNDVSVLQEENFSRGVE